MNLIVIKFWNNLIMMNLMKKLHLQEIKENHQECQIVYFKKRKKFNNTQNSEIDEYLKTSIESPNTNPCEWWKNHKLQYLILSKIARDYIGIPSTSVPSEQAFSKSGELISKRRNRLGDSTIEACMCLNSWIKLLDD